MPLVSSASAISNSCPPALLCRRGRFGGTLVLRLVTLALEAGWVFGGPGAIGTAALGATVAGAVAVVVVVVLPPADPAVDFGDSESPALFLPEFGVVTGV